MTIYENGCVCAQFSEHIVYMRKVIGEFVYEHWHQHQFIEMSKSVRIAKIFAIKDLFAGSKCDVEF